MCSWQGAYGESRAAVRAWLAELMGWTRSWDPLAETGYRDCDGG